MKTINISEAKSHFSEYLSRAANGERFVIHRRDRPVAALVNVDELQRLERSAQAARRLALALGQDASVLEAIESGTVHPIMAAYGLWADDDDLVELDERIYANRRQQAVRPGMDV
ncbi:MAG: type II toxin-antitoxin system Phd/YefM family antitoxin [Chloroflexota bacterium]|nr:type II toxin-antitoxin system Phd/YefM family antitoxin [Chloroflexota bacterium]